MRNGQIGQQTTTNTTTAARLRGPCRLVVGLFMSVAILSACTDEGRARVDDALENVSTSQRDGSGDAALPDVEVPVPEEPAPEEPAPEEPPAAEEPPVAEEPPAEAPPAVGPEEPVVADDGEGLSTEDWILLVSLAIIAVVVGIGAMSATTRRSDARAKARADLNRRLSEVVGQSRWVHDSGSVEVLLAADPDQLATAWNEVRTRMVGVEGHISTLATGTGDVNLDRDLTYLAQCISDLRAAEEGYVTTRLRSRGEETAELTRTSSQTVTDRRQQLQVAIEPVAAAMRE